MVKQEEKTNDYKHIFGEKRGAMASPGPKGSTTHNVYKIEILGHYNVSTTFNVANLSPFVGDSDDEGDSRSVRDRLRPKKHVFVMYNQRYIEHIIQHVFEKYELFVMYHQDILNIS